MRTSNLVFDAHTDMVAADLAFESALHKAYGKRTWLFRYASDQHPVAVAEARDAFHAASARFHDAYHSQGARRVTSGEEAA